MNNRLLNLLVAFFLLAFSFGGARAQFDDQRTFAGNASGTNTIAITIANWTANLAGVPLRFIPAATNTGASTLNVTGVGAIAIRKQTASGLTALSGGEIVSGQLATATFDGTFFVIAAAPNQTLSTRQVLLSGSSATYTTPAGVKQIKVQEIGGGGGGGALITNAGATGGTTSFNSITVIGGSGGAISAGLGGLGGTGGTGTCDVRIAGGDGSSGTTSGGTGASGAGGVGGSGFFGGAGRNGTSSAGSNAKSNTGGGGGAAVGGSTSAGAGSGGAGEYCAFIISSPAATYTYTVGAAGAGGAAGSLAGGNGGTGIIIIDEFYNFLLKRDLEPATNDNSPMFLNAAA